MISLNRIQNFLVKKDIKQKEIYTHNKEENESREVAIQYNNCNFGVKKEENDEISANEIALKGINLTINKEELVVIIGETGSGKTCLVNAILNNLELLNSNEENVEYYHFSPIISYACQDPWIMNGTIRDNIIFYGEFDQERYNKVVSACQLDKDFENLKHGDLTEVGSTGYNISGGLRARISLARAIYKEADIYLFDDPIPSVDPFVSIKIFHQAVVKFLNNKTRIFVTHDTRNLNNSSRVIVMNNFQIEFNGTYKEFSKNNKYKYIIDENEENKSSSLESDITDIKGEYFTNKDDSFGKLLKDEDQVAGKVTYKIYNKFFKIFGGYLFFFF